MNVLDQLHSVRISIDRVSCTSKGTQMPPNLIISG